MVTGVVLVGVVVKLEDTRNLQNHMLTLDSQTEIEPHFTQWKIEKLIGFYPCSFIFWLTWCSELPTYGMDGGDKEEKKVHSGLFLEKTILSI